MPMFIWLRDPQAVFGDDGVDESNDGFLVFGREN
jgi:hypothetical protein